METEGQKLGYDSPTTNEEKKESIVRRKRYIKYSIVPCSYCFVWIIFIQEPPKKAALVQF
jgi:hypothetical protein